MRTIADVGAARGRGPARNGAAAGGAGLLRPVVRRVVDLVPAVAAVVVAALADGRSGLRDLLSRATRWRIGWTWWLLVAGTLSIGLLGVLVPLSVGRDVPPLADFTTYTGIGGISPLGVVAVAFLVNGLGEETGWRGFAVHRLLRDHSLTATAMTVAVAWAAWHLPWFWLVDSFRSMGVLAVGWLVSLVAGSVVLTFLYQRSRNSILLVAGWHTAYNLTSATEATGVVVGAVAGLLVICAALWVLRRERTPFQRRETDEQGLEGGPR